MTQHNKTTQYNSKQNKTQHSASQQNITLKQNKIQQNKTRHNTRKTRTGNKSFTASILREVSKDHPIKAANELRVKDF